MLIFCLAALILTLPLLPLFAPAAAPARIPVPAQAPAQTSASRALPVA